MEDDEKPGRKRPLILAALAAVVALILGGIVVLSPVSARSLATVRPLEPSVTVQRPADRSPEPITSVVSVDEGTRIHTDETGLAEISYFDGSLSRVGPDTDYELSMLDDSNGGRAIGGNLDVGESFHRVAELTGSGDRFDVRTGTAVAAVRGTRFIVTCTSDRACIISVIEGEIEVTNRVTGTKFTLRECQKADALERFSDEESLDMTDVRALDPEDPWLLLNLGLEGITLEELAESCPDLLGSETGTDSDDLADTGGLSGTQTGAGGGAGPSAFAGTRTRGRAPVGGGGTTGGGGGAGAPPSSTQPDQVGGEVEERPRDDSTTTTARPGRDTTTTRPSQGTTTTRPGATTTTRPPGTTTTRPPGTTSTTRPPGTTSTTQACTTGYPPRPC